MVFFYRLARIHKMTYFVWLSLGLWGVAFFQKDHLPDPAELDPSVYREPIQIKQNLKSFTVKKHDTIYTINPLYRYELYGLVVSYHHSDSLIDYYHQLWKDFLNIKDLCVIWGSHIRTKAYQKLTFSNGSWTCYFSTTDQQAWDAFQPNKLSNNHLLADDPIVAEKILDARIGDQIHLKGYLSSYSNNHGFRRGTSITRDDTGQGACETVYVTDFQILREGNVGWNRVYRFSGGLLIFSLFTWIVWFLRRPVGAIGGTPIRE